MLVLVLNSSGHLCFFRAGILVHRHTLEKIGQLDPYVSAVDLDADALEAEVRTMTHMQVTDS
jgi:hypothetical protein